MYGTRKNANAYRQLCHTQPAKVAHQESSREKERVVENALRPELAHDKLYALHHGLTEADLMGRISTQTLFRKTSAGISFALAMSVRYSLLENTCQALQRRPSLVGRLLDLQLGKQRVNPLEALFAKHLAAVLLYLVCAFVDLGDQWYQLISHNIGTIGRSRRGRWSSEPE